MAPSSSSCRAWFHLHQLALMPWRGARGEQPHIVPYGDGICCFRDEAGSKEERLKERGALAAPLVLAVSKARRRPCVFSSSISCAAGRRRALLQLHLCLGRSGEAPREGGRSCLVLFQQRGAGTASSASARVTFSAFCLAREEGCFACVLGAMLHMYRANRGSFCDANADLFLAWRR